MRGRRNSGAEEKKGAPDWMVSYGDMMSLLLCFFILLYAFSSIDVQKFQVVMLSLKGAFGFMDGGRTVNNDPLTGGTDILPEDTAILELIDIEKTVKQVESALQEEGLTGTVLLVQEQRGLIIRFVDSTLFESGKENLTPQARIILDKTARILRDMDNKIRVEGHTDNRPINTEKFPSNWELSAARATTVIRYFIESHHLSPLQLSAAGYGEYYPVAPNDTSENRALNRRIDIVVIWATAAEQEPQLEAQPKPETASMNRKGR